jgi:hypothetical protein
MARTNIAAQTTLGAYPALPVTPGSDLTEVPADVGNGNETTIVQGKTIVVAHNINVAAKTVTFTSVADDFGRTGDITAYSIAAGKVKIFGPFRTAGWSHSGKLWIDANHADVLLSVITLP